MRAIESGAGDPHKTRLKVVNDTSGEIVAHLFLTHQILGSTKPYYSEDQPEAEKPSLPDFFESKVLSAVNSAVEKVDRRWEGVEHMGE
jgi:hypothetical protein